MKCWFTCRANHQLVNSRKRDIESSTFAASLQLRYMKIFLLISLTFNGVFPFARRSFPERPITRRISGQSYNFRVDVFGYAPVLSYYGSFPNITQELVRVTRITLGERTQTIRRGSPEYLAVLIRSQVCLLLVYRL